MTVSWTMPLSTYPGLAEFAGLQFAGKRSRNKKIRRQQARQEAADKAKSMVPAQPAQPDPAIQKAKRRSFRRKIGLILAMLFGLSPIAARHTILKRPFDGIHGDKFDRPALPYHSPTHPAGYADYNQQLADEGRHLRAFFPIITLAHQMLGKKALNPESIPTSSKMGKLELMRSEFNRTGDLDLFNPYLHYRPTLAKDKTKLAAHDQRINAFAKHPDIQWGFIDKWGTLWQLDRSTRYMTAAIMLDMYHNRPDLLDKLINQKKPLRMVFTSNLEMPFFLQDRNHLIKHESAGGHFALGNGGITFSHDSFWMSVLTKGDGNTLVVHESSHGLDARFVPGLSWAMQSMVCTGTLPDMPEKDLAIFEKERERLFAKYNKHKDTSGMGSYAYNWRWEFLAVSLEHFYDQPEVLHKASPDIYNVYKRYFKLDPLNGYADVVPETPKTKTNVNGHGPQLSQRARWPRPNEPRPFKREDWAWFNPPAPRRKERPNGRLQY